MSYQYGTDSSWLSQHLSIFVALTRACLILCIVSSKNMTRLEMFTIIVHACSCSSGHSVFIVRVLCSCCFVC